MNINEKIAILLYPRGNNKVLTTASQILKLNIASDLTTQIVSPDIFTCMSEKMASFGSSYGKMAGLNEERCEKEVYKYTPRRDTNKFKHTKKRNKIASKSRVKNRSR